MNVNTNKIPEFKKYESFFDYWNYNDIDTLTQVESKKVANEIAEKIKLKQIYKELPEHCFQLLFLS